MIEDNDIFKRNDYRDQQVADTAHRSETVKHSTDSVLDTIPPEQIRYGVYGEIGVYGMSLQGRSHKKNHTPCQDSNHFCYLENEKILIAAIADGVGSCIWSHWGSYTAVKTAVMSLKREITAISGGNVLKIPSLSTSQIEAMFHSAFSDARRAVEDLADREQRSVYNFQSTLTVALYDGTHLTCCHIGDDGVVAQGVSGKYQMITQRIKGDEANSVVTLQSGKWFITTISTEITGFLMSTDGILDFYVMNKAMNNSVYYPFFKACVYEMEPKHFSEAPERVKVAMENAREKLLDDEGPMCSVTDDMTVLVVANQRLLCQSARPAFSEEAWNREIRQLRKMQWEKLHPKKRETMAKPVSSQKQNPNNRQGQRETANPVAVDRQMNGAGVMQPGLAHPKQKRNEEIGNIPRKTRKDPCKENISPMYPVPEPGNSPYDRDVPYYPMWDLEEKKKGKGILTVFAEAIDALFGDVVIELEDDPPLNYGAIFCSGCGMCVKENDNYCPVCGRQIKK